MTVSAQPLTASWLASLPPQERNRFLASLSPDEQEELFYRWKFWARPNQIAPPGDWRTWLLMAGRGFGKTRTGAEWIRERAALGGRRLAIVGRTAADVRDVMIEGESGLLAISPPWFKPRYQPSKRRLTWPNGSIATTYSADRPDTLRGPQHHDAWCDELAAWRFPEAWDQLQFGLRLGDDPRVVVSTTPRPVKHIRELLQQSTTIVSRGGSYENRANLAGAFFDQIIRRYEGTRLGRQELEGILLDDNPFALWQRTNLDEHRVGKVPELARIVVAIDPPSTSEDEDSAEAGIVVAGLGMDGHGYVLEDLSQQASPLKWAQIAVAAFHRWKADRVVAETNQGGEMVEHTLRSVDKFIPFTGVHASRGKRTRAEPVSALYEQGRVHHFGVFATLEDQMCEWMPDVDDSPDRMDALVWAFFDLFPLATPSWFQDPNVRDYLLQRAKT